MTTETLESLGISQEDVLERVSEKMTDRLMAEYGDEGEIGRLLEKRVIEKVNAAVEEIAGRNVLPNVAQYVENLTLQQTNQWGERRGESLTFTEYLVQRVEHYMNEKVDRDGKSKREDSFGWRPAQTRIAHLVHEHLHWSIETAMREALADANSKIVGGIEGAVKIALKELENKLKVNVKTR